MREYRVPFDPRNPGQYLACCGLFELAELGAPGGVSCFQEAGAEFVLRTDADLPPGDLALSPQGSFEGKPYDDKLEPLELVMAGRVFTLCWWLNDAQTSKSSLKTHGGNQRPREVFDELVRLLDYTPPLETLFQRMAYTTKRFGVDARAAWDAIDAGYSPNDIGQNAATFPWVEILAVIGLQGFRPAEQKRTRFRYSTWADLLPIAAARAACAAPWPGLPAHTFEFEIASRGQGYKTFLFAEGVLHV